MDAKLDNLIAKLMELPPEIRAQLAELLAPGRSGYEVRDVNAQYEVRSRDEKWSLQAELDGMKLVTVVLPDELAKQAQAAGLLGSERLEELIRGALQEQRVRVTPDVSGVDLRRRLVRENGYLVVEALPGEQPITDAEIRSLLNNMEW